MYKSHMFTAAFDKHKFISDIELNVVLKFIS